MWGGGGGSKRPGLANTFWVRNAFGWGTRSLRDLGEGVARAERAVYSERAKGGGEASLRGWQNCFGLETLWVGGPCCSEGKRSGLLPPLRRPTARAGARACVAATLARVCRAAERERESAEFFWQRLGRCATWPEGSLVTRAVRPLFFCAGGFCRFRARHLGLPRFLPFASSPLPHPPLLSISKIK